MYEGKAITLNLYQLWTKEKKEELKKGRDWDEERDAVKHFEKAATECL